MCVCVRNEDLSLGLTPGSLLNLLQYIQDLITGVTNIRKSKIRDVSTVDHSPLLSLPYSGIQGVLFVPVKVY